MRGESPEGLVGVGKVRTIHGGTRGEFGYTVRNQAEGGGRSTSEYGRGSEVGGRGSGLGLERGLGEAISNARI